MSGNNIISIILVNEKNDDILTEPNSTRKSFYRPTFFIIL